MICLDKICVDLGLTWEKWQNIGKETVLVLSKKVLSKEWPCIRPSLWAVVLFRSLELGFLIVGIGSQNFGI